MRSTLLLLAACGHAAVSAKNPASQTPTVPATVSLTATLPSAQNTNLADDIVVDFSAAMDATSTIAAITVSPSIDCAAVVTGAEYRCRHALFTPATTYAVSIAVSAHDPEGDLLNAASSFSFTTALAGAPVIQSVALLGQTSLQVRQGQGPISVSLTGTGLDFNSASFLSNASFSGIAATATSGNGGTTANLLATIPHALSQGPLPLVVSNTTGTTTANALSVTFISADATNGDDTATGTSDAPFRTLTHALSLASSGDTVTLAAGTYSAGETWPTGAANVNDNVTLVGHGTDDTLLTTQTANAVALQFSGRATVLNLSAYGFYRAAVGSGAATVTLSNVHFHDNQDCGVCASDNAQLTLSGEFDHNGTSGIAASDEANVDASNVNAHDNPFGVSLSGASHLLASLAQFSSNGTGVNISGEASAAITGDIDSNTSDGLYADTSGSVSFSGQVLANGRNGLSFNGTGEASVSGATVNANQVYGVLAAGNSAQLSVSDSQFSNNAGGGVALAENGGSATATIASSSFASNGIGIEWTGTLAKLSVTGCTFSGNTLALSDSCAAVSIFSGVTINGTSYPTTGEPETETDSSSDLWDIANGGAITFTP